MGDAHAAHSEAATHASGTSDFWYQATGTTVVGTSAGGVSALSVISLRRNGINTTSKIPTARLPRPSSVKSFAYPGLVATAVLPVGLGIIAENSTAKR